MKATKRLAELEAQREVIDGCDEAIIAALAQRTQAARRIGELKKILGRAIRDEQRENDLKERRGELCAQWGISGALVEEIFAVIVEYSRRIQEKLDGSNERG